MATTTKTKKEINLGPNYSIRPYKQGGVEVIFTEKRVRTKEDGTKEAYTFTDKFYFTRVSQALRFYVDRELSIDESLELMIDKAESIYKRIDSLEAVFKTF
jgi:hypothetical protein